MLQLLTCLRPPCHFLSSSALYHFRPRKHHKLGQRGTLCTGSCSPALQRPCLPGEAVLCYKFIPSPPIAFDRGCRGPRVALVEVRDRRAKMSCSKLPIRMRRLGGRDFRTEGYLIMDRVPLDEAGRLLWYERRRGGVSPVCIMTLDSCL